MSGEKQINDIFEVKLKRLLDDVMNNLHRFVD